MLFSAGEDEDYVEDCYQSNSFADCKTPEQVLKSIFGYDSFRPLQKEVIANVLDGRDTLAVMPTGGGKSLCYQIPAMLLPGLTVVVSPLIALMQDQVSQLEAWGIPAVFLNSSLEWSEYLQKMNLIRQGKIKLLYVSPEGL
ncbi:MAG: DEAD/DEAH box helicase, partial [Treponema sp.]|nr:DEAD/DEAH box helicase [Treponema sp.]